MPASLCKDAFALYWPTKVDRTAGFYVCPGCGRRYNLGRAQREAADIRSSVRIPKHGPSNPRPGAKR